MQQGIEEEKTGVNHHFIKLNMLKKFQYCAFIFSYNCFKYRYSFLHTVLLKKKKLILNGTLITIYKIVQGSLETFSGVNLTDCRNTTYTKECQEALIQLVI